MLDIKFIRENQDLVKQAIKNRALKIDLGALIKIDDLRRKILAELEEKRSQRNLANDQISVLLKQGKDAKSVIASMKDISNSIGLLDVQVKEQELLLNNLLLTIPNLPHESLPIGGPSQNKVVRAWGEPKKFDFKTLTHLQICQNLDIVDFNRATKITGSNFILFKGSGARLERALINFMLDLHTAKHGYTEIFPPFLVNRASMLGTGQLPKMEEDMYKLEGDDLFLIPTAEVPLTNIHRDEILEEDKLPILYTAYTACFRREAGSYGKDTKGLIRVHEFDKVEMVKFVKPEDSYQELDKLVANAEEVLQLLDIPYRVLMLATEDLSFSASKCYDLEAYSPGMDKWLEVSSCSNFEAFQARRANIKYRRKDNKKLEFVHTLNGSGIALARTVVAILENYQQADGTVLIPKVLQPYFNGQERIS
ncbi:MAG: serine--tRNA ligase [Candidatus Omnitrophica bacterium]|jgi:seryl-tRNA synthetase|nr:serine--tRNA ligase [Candidatus Omnitrophota bacterium]